MLPNVPERTASVGSDLDETNIERMLYTMKKFFALLLALVLTMSLAACGGGDKPAADGAAFKTVEEGKLHMSTNAAFPPYEMLTDDGGFEGIDVEVAEAIAGKLGLEDRKSVV